MKGMERDKMESLDLELQAATQALQTARAKKEEALRQASEAATAALLAQRLREEDNLAQARAKTAGVEQAWIDRRAREEEERRKQIALEQAKKLKLELAVAKAEEERRLEHARQTMEQQRQLKELADLAFLEELERNRLAAEMARSRIPLIPQRVETGPAVQADGLESSASAMSEQPENWGTPLLRNLFGRSAETNRQPPAQTVVSSPPAESPTKTALIEEFGLEAVQDAEQFLMDSQVGEPGISQLEEVERVLRLRAI